MNKMPSKAPYRFDLESTPFGSPYPYPKHGETVLVNVKMEFEQAPSVIRPLIMLRASRDRNYMKEMHVLDGERIAAIFNRRANLMIFCRVASLRLVDECGSIRATYRSL